MKINFYVLLCSLTVLLCSCMTSHQDALDELSEDVIKRDRGVTVDIEPGKKV